MGRALKNIFKLIKSFFLLFLSVFLLTACANGQQQYFKVIHVADGDTFTILDQNNKQIKVRIQGIDAPEKKMPFGNVSKEFLQNLCFGKTVSLTVIKLDRYGRTVALAKLPDGRDISSEMIKAGMAWHYTRYSSDKNLTKLELRARKLKLGLWKDQNPQEPWEYRRLKREYHKNTKRFKQRY